MQKSLIAVAGLLLTCTSFAISNPADATVANYQLTCNNISLNQNVLSANCRTKAGAFKNTSLRLRGIENIDGTLKVTNPNKVANFNLSCNNTAVNGNVLSGSCRKINGAFKNTSLVLNGIENIDGVLRYTSNP